MEIAGALVVLAFVLFVVVAALAVIGAILKFLFWLVLLPFRLVVYLLVLPFLLLKFLIGGVLLVVLGPVIVIGAVLAFIAFALALLAPLLPLLALAALIWFIVRVTRPAVA